MLEASDGSLSAVLTAGHIHSPTLTHTPSFTHTPTLTHSPTPTHPLTHSPTPSPTLTHSPTPTPSPLTPPWFAIRVHATSTVLPTLQVAAGPVDAISLYGVRVQ
jgi:hypothetical protein